MVIVLVVLVVVIVVVCVKRRSKSGYDVAKSAYYELGTINHSKPILGSKTPYYFYQELCTCTCVWQLLAGNKDYFMYNWFEFAR